MKIYKTVEQIKADIVDSKLVIKGDVRFDVSFSIDASIVVDAGNIDAWDIKANNIDAGDIDAGDIDANNIDAGDIDAGDIDAENIDALDIDAGDIDAENIDALDIKAKNIKAGDIDAWDIDAENIDAWDIKAKNIKAGDISFYAFAVAYVSFKCKSILGRRENSKYFCLDNEVEITGETLKASE